MEPISYQHIYLSSANIPFQGHIEFQSCYPMDSIEQFEKGNRPELAEKEKKELEILQSYLPEEMNEDELNKIIAAVIKETGAQSMQEMGRVMKEVLEKTSGRVDGKRVSEGVKQSLSQK